MKFLCYLLVIISLFFVMPSCGKSENKPADKTDDSKVTEMQEKTDDMGGRFLKENVLKKTITSKNPNTMAVESRSRSAAKIESEKKLAEKFAEEFIDFVAKNSLENAFEEVTKARDGVFGSLLPETYFYLPVFKQVKEKSIIMAHGTNKDFVGVELNSDEAADISGWKFLKEAVIKAESENTNSVWVENVYWKDPSWADNNSARFSAYNRFFSSEGELYWIHYSIWLDE